jgi:hypothetical protein
VCLPALWAHTQAPPYQGRVTSLNAKWHQTYEIDAVKCSFNPGGMTVGAAVGLCFYSRRQKIWSFAWAVVQEHR